VAALATAGYEVVLFSGDVRSETQVETFMAGVDSVIHMAAIVPVTQVDSNPAAAIDVNVGGTARVARTAAARKLRFVYVSTSHVYAASGSVLTETAPIGPSSLYGLTKRQGEEWALALHDSPLILRAFSFFDAEQRPPYLVPSLRQRIEQAPPGGVVEVRGALSVRDICDAHWMAELIARLSAGSTVGVVNCATGMSTTVFAVAEALIEICDRRDVVLRAGANEHRTEIAADVSLARSLLGPLPAFDLRDGLRRALNE
jgi:nucleoside-diphosphate-sugar epimerase